MSDSRAAGVSLSQSLTAAMSELPESTIKTLKKDTNNLAGANKKIKQDACEEYLKEYKRFAKGEIDSVTHPVTKKQLTRKDRIDFIAEQCRTVFDLSVSGSRSKSNSSSKSSSKSDGDSHYKSLKLPLEFKDIDKILEYPTQTPKVKKTHLLSLFKDKIIEDEAAKRLEAYLEDESVTDENVLLYRKIKQHINDNYLTKREYDPFMSQKEFNKAIKNKYYSKPYEPSQVITNRINGISSEADRLVREALLYSDFNKTADDFKRNAKENYYKYYAIEFMLLQLKFIYDGTHHSRIAQTFLELIDKLIEGTINISDPDASVSFEKSPDWSASPDDPILKAEYKTNKNKELERIMDASKEYAGSINDSDFYTIEEWKDMPLRKLKSVVVIPYKENGKTYANAYYIKSLYTAWYMAVKDNKPFVNPANRKEFSQEDKTKILEVMQTLYPGLRVPRYGSTGGRSDVIVNYYNDYAGTYKIAVSYLYNCLTSYDKCHYHLVLIEFPSSFAYADDNSPEDETNVPLAYNPTFLFEMINTLMRRNKVVGKNIPFKIAEPFAELHDKKINKAQYMRFFDKLRLMM
jgi:hypothetical protein|tara:strand:+ start:59 stop:1786 length:1728 start_codon:yes stop_codon:yes gene_type:complete